MVHYSDTHKSSKASERIDRNAAAILEFADEVAALQIEARKKRVDRRRLKIVLFMSDLLCVLGPLVAWSLLYLPEHVAVAQTGLLAAVTLPTFMLVALNVNAYRLRDGAPTTVPIWPILTALAGSVLGLILLIFLVKNSSASRAVVTGSFMTSFLVLVVARTAFSAWAARRFPNGHFATLCIYDGVELNRNPRQTQISATQHGLSADAQNVEMIERLAAASREFDRLVVHCPPEKRNEWASILRSLSIPGEIVLPELAHLDPVGIRRRRAGITAVIASGPLRWHERGMKRLFDLFVVCLALPFLLLATLVIGLAIKLDSKGPVIFKQDRIGRDNRPFQIFKFRSMRTESLDHAGVQSTERGDPRITRLGAFLRRTSLDELPQLYNVLLGDMSLVGPRPHAKLSRAGDRLFWEVDEAYWLRHSVKPGITGLAQVRGHRGNTFHEDHLKERLNSDLEYVAEWSLLGDVRILFRTFGVLVHSNAF